MQLRSTIPFLVFTLIFSVILQPVSPARAAYDPCYTYSSQVNYAQRDLQNAESNLLRTENDLFRAQNQVASRKGQLEAQVAWAEANLEAVRSSAGAFTAACVARSFFFFRGRIGNCAFIAANNANRRAQARAQVDRAQSNLRIYDSYSANYIQRMAARVVVAQVRVNESEARLSAAQQEYQQCVDSIPQ